ncbi:hypothetical protein EMIT0P171_60005 [Pseudomonas sp. IT-P171]
MIRVEFLCESLVQRAAHQTSQVMNAEPGLVCLRDRVEESVVAGENGGDEMRMDFRRI